MFEFRAPVPTYVKSRRDDITLMIRFLDEIGSWTCLYGECGALCCGDTRELTHRDVSRISEATGRDWREFARFERGAFELKLEDGRCIFLDGLECSIHRRAASEPAFSEGVEPLVCRILPFRVDRIKYSDEPILYLDSLDECPGYGSGDGLGEDFVERIEGLASRLLQERHELRKALDEGKTPEDLV